MTINEKVRQKYLTGKDETTWFDNIISLARANHTKQWWIHTPRKHKVPTGYYNPLFYQAVECERVNQHGQYNEQMKDYLFNGYSIYDEDYNYHSDINTKVHIGLRHYMYPHYFLCKDLMSLLNMTNVADTIDLTKTRFPFDACLFTLPMKHLKESGQYVTQLAYYRSFDIQPLSYQLRAKELGACGEEGRIYDAPFSRKWAATLSLDEEPRIKEQAKLLKELEGFKGEPCRVIPCFSVVILYDTTQISVCSYPISDTSFKNILHRFKHEYTVEGMPTPKFGETYDQNDIFLEKRPLKPEDEVDSLQNLSKLVLTIILYMGARKDEWDPLQRRIPPKKKKKGTPTVLYSPNFLGKKYNGTMANQKKSSSVSNYKLKPHWRSGYLGIRWYGKNRDVAKKVWVEPYPVNEEAVVR